VCVVCAEAPATLHRAGIIALCLGCAQGQVQIEDGQTPPTGRVAQVDALLIHLVPLAIQMLQQLDDAAFAAQWAAWLAAPEQTQMFDEVLPTGDGSPATIAKRVDTLSQALAAMSFVPGGVPFAGRRYLANRQ